jgi:lysophospholipase L1-like esterase
LTKKIVFASLLLLALALQAGAAIAVPQKAAPERQLSLFQWSVPSHFGSEHDTRGRVIETQPGEVRQGPWPVDLVVADRACAEGAVYSWQVDGRRATPKRLDEDSCHFRHRFPAEGTYEVSLTATVNGKQLSQTQKVTVQDWLIVSLGDSVAAGEAIPDVPAFRQAIWQSVRCHRSARAGTALAAKQIEDDDRRSSVTFVHLACSGATVPAGLIGPYEGAEPVPGKAPLEAQMSVLERIAKRRQVDAVLLSAGANDIHFGDVTRFCAIPANNCFERPLPEFFGGDGVRRVEEVLASSLHDLPDRFRQVAERIPKGVPPSRVYIVPYFDPLHDADGRACERILGSITKPELELAESRMLAPLNEAVAAAAKRHRWHEVEGVTQRFGKHGYCARGQAWVTTLHRSVESLGGTLKGRFLGTLHPNQQGQEVISGEISKALERDLYPGRDFPLRVLPKPAPVDEDGSGLGDVAGDVLRIAGLIFATALLGLVGVTAGLNLLWHLGEGLIWLAGETPWPLLLGLAVGALILFLWRTSANTAKPFVSLIKTARPLLLPLLVVLGVGAVQLPPAVQIVISAALLVLAWRLIFLPEAQRSYVTDRGLSLIGVVARRAVVALGVGALVVLVAKKLGVDNPYFEAIGDVASSLVLIAIVLWVAALVMRLFSYATSRLRAVVAFAIGLALIILGMGIGIVPGNAAVRDAWTPLFAALAGSALLLLVIDAVRSAIAGDGGGAGGAPVAAADGEDPPPPPPLTSLVADWGFSTAAVAAIVLAGSTGYGLIAAADEGRPLNPPADESAEAVAPPRSTLVGADPLALAKKYGPVLVFTNEERWAPVRVDSYVEHATLTGPGMKPNKDVLLSDLPKHCPPSSRQTNCYTLSIECESGDLPCADGFDVHHRPYREGAVYVRIVEKSKLKGQEKTTAFPDRGFYRDRLATLIQYWYFYYYDEWKAPVFAGLLTQRHEGDWEAVTIGLDEAKRPLFVADSAHCEGTWRPWQEIEASTQLPGPPIHPLVAVAEGSHANYAESGGERAPDWASCSGTLPAGVSTAVSYASNIRDKTEYGWLWYPPSDGWIEVTSKSPPMTFPGTWGGEDVTTLRNFQSTELGSGAGPQTPTLQALWREPVQLIFCRRYSPRRCEPE